jgi:hypothetical protein
MHCSHNLRNLPLPTDSFSPQIDDRPFNKSDVLFRNLLLVRFHLRGNNCDKVLIVANNFLLQVGATVNPHLDPKVAHLLKVIAATIIFHLIDRQSEYIQRVGFM